ncbi:MAG TPA: hypothetical protein VG406_15865 [Isosphaeraceae bacterium]|nr:hypothetical protein [Isosphaeraceae bacterium]
MSRLKDADTRENDCNSSAIFVESAAQVDDVQDASMFDPYHKWLGIPRDRRPPTFYQLLSIAPTEEDPEVIDAASVRQSAYVRNFQNGPHAADCSRILGEIALARGSVAGATFRNRRQRKKDPSVASEAGIAVVSPREGRRIGPRLSGMVSAGGASGRGRPALLNWAPMCGQGSSRSASLSILADGSGIAPAIMP